MRTPAGKEFGETSGGDADLWNRQLLTGYLSCDRDGRGTLTSVQSAPTAASADRAKMVAAERPPKCLQSSSGGLKNALWSS